MPSDMTPEQQLEAQKANCPFCKIAKKEIPAEIIFEDDVIMAILDINPLAKGHTVVFPKEHVPIMQMLPQQAFVHLFSKIPDLVNAVKKGAVCPSVNLYLASGGVAGQQMPHFILHIVPRENNDGIENFDKAHKEIPADEMAKVMPVFKQNLELMMRADAKRAAPPPETKPNADANHAVSAEQKKMIAEFLESNDEMRKLLLSSPEKFAEAIIKNEQVKNIFAGLDLKVLSDKLKPAFEGEPKDGN